MTERRSGSSAASRSGRDGPGWGRGPTVGTTAARGAARGEDTELEERRRFLLDSLRDLDHEWEAGELDEGDYRRLRDHYTVEAATVLRTIEAGADRRRRQPERRRPRHRVAGDDGPPLRRGTTRRRVLTIVAAVGLALAAGVSVASIAGERVGDQPATGTIGRGSAEQLARAHQLESSGQAVEALKLYDAVLADEPDNVEALAYRGWLLKLAGITDRAQESLDRAVAVDPRYPDARFFRGMLLFQDRDDPVAAVGEFDAFLASNPDPAFADAVRNVMDQARGAAAARQTEGSSGG